MIFLLITICVNHYNIEEISDSNEGLDHLSVESPANAVIPCVVARERRIWSDSL